MFIAPPGSGGQVVACPHCQGQLRMPAAAAPQPVSTPPRAAAPTPAPAPPRAAAPTPAPAPPRAPAPLAQPTVAVAQPSMPARPPAPAAGVPQINTGASSAVPVINDPKQATATGRMMQRRKSNNNIVLYIAVPIAILFVLGAIGVIALIANKKSGYDEAVKVTDEMFVEMDNLVAALGSVKDQKSAKSASRRIDKIVDRINELYAKAKKIKVTDAQGKKLEKRMEAKMESLQPRLMKAALNAGMNSEEDPDFMRSMDRLESLGKLVN